MGRDMKTSILQTLFAALVLGAVSLWTSCTSRAQEAPAVIAITNVNVLPMDSERILSDHTVLVRDGRIHSLGPTANFAVPSDATVVDGEGGYLFPGLAEMHGHIPQPDSNPQYVEDLLFLYVANGITTVRGMQGSPGQLELADRVASGEIIGPTLYLAGPAFSGGSIDSPEQAEARVRQQKAEGWHLLKVLPGLSREEYDAMARTANEVNIPFAGHVPGDVGLIHAIEMGQETFDHVDGFLELLSAESGSPDPAALENIAFLTRESGAWIVPTMAVWEVLLGALDSTVVEGYEELRYLPPNVRNQWIQSHRNRLSNPDLDREHASRVASTRIGILRALNEAGVPILLGTDSPQQFSVPGFSTRHEFERMTAAGMTPYEILRSGSFNVGRYFRQHDAFGVITPGMRADLVLSRNNPLENITHAMDPEGVMVRGRWFARADIDAGLDAIARRYAN